MVIRAEIPVVLFVIAAIVYIPRILDWFSRKRHGLPSRKERAVLLGLSFMHQHKREFDALELSDLTGVLTPRIYSILDRMADRHFVTPRFLPGQVPRRRVYGVTANGAEHIQAVLNKRPPRESRQ